ncbi:MFS general substrate transporter [Venturia nashicola]|uniref:MFS general substrate transporter n=1 Tax=Venturia nashicola TaxID=86259 RepID=A0A4Z1P4S5_9PEZI|nr:MFS general substrate transporter [Venturia nashicola]TLD29764.1 MFS general substrate transporter [Venturia nashicola]
MSATPPEPMDRKQSEGRYDRYSDSSAMDSPKSSMYKSRHISLQSRVDSIAEQNIYGYSSDDQHSHPDLPAAYKQPSRSRSYLLESSYPGYEPEAIGEPPSPTMDTHMLPQSAIKMSTFHEILFVGVVAVSHLMTQAGLGQALVPLDIISKSFNVTNPGEQSWFIASYSLTVGTFILISGRLGDILGHKRMFVFGYAWFGVWSAFAGFAVYPHKQIFFDFCRAMQGVGPALIMPNGLALFGRAYPPGIKKNIVFSIFGAVAPMGFVIGATFGSLFAELVWWPWAFWSFGIACWGLAVLALLVVPRELSEKPMNAPGFDFTGSLMAVIGLVLVNVAWNNGPLFGWGTPHVYFLLIIGLLCLVGFVWVERRAENPILPMHAMTGSVNFVLACVGLGWGAFGVWVFYTFRFLEKVRHFAPLTASAAFAPAVVTGILAAGATGFMLTHTPVSFVMMVSMCAFCLGIIIAATQPAQQTYWAQMFVSIFVMPFGMDMSFPAASVILSNCMPPEHQGLAMSLVNTVVNYSISLSLGIAGTIEVYTTPDMTAPGAELQGIRAAFYTAIGLSLAGVICGALFFMRSLQKEGWKVMEH